MPKQTTNQLIDTIAGVLADFDWHTYGDEVGEAVRRADQTSWITDLAREIARAVR